MIYNWNILNSDFARSLIYDYIEKKSEFDNKILELRDVNGNELFGDKRRFYFNRYTKQEKYLDTTNHLSNLFSSPEEKLKFIQELDEEETPNFITLQNAPGEAILPIHFIPIQRSEHLDFIWETLISRDFFGLTYKDNGQSLIQLRSLDIEDFNKDIDSIANGNDFINPL